MLLKFFAMTVDQVLRRKIYGLDQEYGIHLVQFDTSLDPVTYHAYQQMEDWDLIADTNLTEGTSWLHPFAGNFTTHTMPLQKTYVETIYLE
jgi:hypothetical protein